MKEALKNKNLLISYILIILLFIILIYQHIQIKNLKCNVVNIWSGGEFIDFIPNYSYLSNCGLDIENFTTNNLTGTKLFMDKIIECPDDMNVSDRFSCIYKLNEKTNSETNELVKKIISQAPLRLKEIRGGDVGPLSFEYGGEDFLTNLPVVIKKVEESRNQFIESVCISSSMIIFGGSGMDLEKNACMYFFNKQYLEIIKNLENGLNAKN